MFGKKKRLYQAQLKVFLLHESGPDPKTGLPNLPQNFYWSVGPEIFPDTSQNTARYISIHSPEGHNLYKTYTDFLNPRIAGKAFELMHSVRDQYRAELLTGNYPPNKV